MMTTKRTKWKKARELLGQESPHPPLRALPLLMQERISATTRKMPPASRKMELRRRGGLLDEGFTVAVLHLYSTKP